MAIFGAVPNNAPALGKGRLVDVIVRGHIDRRGVQLYTVGTVAIKHWLFARLSTDAEKDAGERLSHFSAELSRDYFAGLASESFNPARNRYEKRRGTRNEPLDTWVYAFAAAHHPELRLHHYTSNDWQQLADRITTQTAQNAARPEKTAPVQTSGLDALTPPPPPDPQPVSIAGRRARYFIQR